MISHLSSYTTEESQHESLNPIESTENESSSPVPNSDKTVNETAITSAPIINNVQIIDTQGSSPNEPVMKNIDVLLLNLNISERKEVIHQELYGLVKKLKPFLAKTVTDYLMVKFVCMYIFVCLHVFSNI